MLPPNDTMRADIFMLLGGAREAQCVLFFTDAAGDINQVIVDTLCNDLETWIGTDLRNYASADCKFTKVTVSGYDNGGLEFQRSQDVNLLGTRVAESGEPPNVAVVVTWRTALPTKRGRGRSFFPCPSSTDIGAAGQFFDPAKSNLEVAADNLVSGAALTSADLVVWSRLDNLTRPVTGFTVQDKVRTQSRRLR